MSNRLAAIDIGSNSVRLLTCRRDQTGLVERSKQVNTTRLAKGVDQTGRLAEPNIIQTIAVLKDYATQLAELGIKNCSVFATSAVRDAANSDDFLARVKAETGFNITILSGQQEAAYGFLGVVKGNSRPADKILVIDVGGGSTELIFGDQSGAIEYSDSFDIGAVRMTERFGLTHAMQPAQYKAVESELFKQLQSKNLSHYKGAALCCIAIGGTATSLAAIDLQLPAYDAEAIQRHQMTQTALAELTGRLVAATRAEKLNMAGLAAGRVDIISAGALIINGVMRYFEQPTLYFSDYDNLEGSLQSERIDG
ncbi:MAG: hypothetical protein CR995_00655 [Clostridiales bacterium]|nr:MAG: hypothetical protein CR995_00655 [Clostridiales bacterium]